MSHTESQSTTTVSHLQIRSGRQPGADQREAVQQVPPSVVVNLSPSLGAVNAADEDIESDPRTRLIQSIVEQLTGEKVKTVKASDLRGGRGHPHNMQTMGGIAQKTPTHPCLCRSAGACPTVPPPPTPNRRRLRSASAPQSTR
ncbi:MAG: hypothetical protein IPG42_02345 [Betaproteobacteria bacterium]|nr:hypothetical protein [Betaproteobacteria bacterium]